MLIGKKKDLHDNFFSVMTVKILQSQSADNTADSAARSLSCSLHASGLSPVS